MDAMQYALNARASTKEDAKTALAAQFAVYAIGAPAVIDWTLPSVCASAMIDSLADSDSLDIVASVSGDLVFEGDAVHSLKFSCECVLTDRIA